MELHPGKVAAVYRGVEQPDPEQTGMRMCQDPELSNAALRAGQSLNTACGVCEKSGQCGYLRQQGYEADLWVLPNQLLFNPRPSWLPDPERIIVDEDFIQAGLAGCDNGYSIRLAISTFDSVPPAFTKGCRGTDEDRIDLGIYRQKILKALAKGEGPLTRKALENVGLSAEDCRQARAIEWQYRMKVKFEGSEKRSEILSAFGDACTFTPGLPKAWELAAKLLDSDNELSPNITIVRGEKMPRGEGTADYLHFKYRKEVSKSYNNKLTILLDATGLAELVRSYYPDVVMVADVAADTPYRYVRQITDRSCAKSMFVFLSDANTADNNVGRLARYLEVEAAKYRGHGEGDIDVLMVCQNDVEQALTSKIDLPRVDIAHFNDIAGSNKWSGVAKLVIVGRTLPPPETVEQLATVLGGRSVASISGAANNWWTFPVPIHKSDGGTEYVMAPRHPDPLVEAVRRSICEGQLLQTEGRGRAVNRTADNSLDVDILTNIPLPILVDETTTWDEILPSPVDVMAARGIVGLDWPTVAAVLPDIFPSSQAAKMWFGRNKAEKDRLMIGEKVTNSYKDVLIGICYPFAEYHLCHYRVAGNRKKRSALVDFHVHPEPGLSLSQLYDHEVEVISAKAINPTPVAYLDPPFEEAVPALPPAVPQVPQLIVENKRLVSPIPEPVTINTSLSGDFLPIDAGYHTILDWVTGGGIPEEDDHSEAIDIWLANGHFRSSANPVAAISHVQCE